VKKCEFKVKVNNHYTGLYRL